MTHQAGVRTVVMGGRPTGPPPMQAAESGQPSATLLTRSGLRLEGNYEGCLGVMQLVAIVTARLGNFRHGSRRRERLAARGFPRQWRFLHLRDAGLVDSTSRLPCGANPATNR